MKTKFWVEFSGDVDEIVGRLKLERDAKAKVTHYPDSNQSY